MQSVPDSSQFTQPQINKLNGDTIAAEIVCPSEKCRLIHIIAKSERERCRKGEEASFVEQQRGM